MAIDTSTSVRAEFFHRWISVKQMKDILAELEDDNILAPNRVGNLSVYRPNSYDGRYIDYIGFVDFASEFYQPDAESWLCAFEPQDNRKKLKRKRGKHKVRTISKLIEDLRGILAEHGDLLVWLRLSWLGHDDTESRSAPLTEVPKVMWQRQIGARFWFRGFDPKKKIVVLHKDND